MKIPVPPPDAPWLDVIDFALSYNGYDRHGTTRTGNIANRLEAKWRATGAIRAKLPTLRCALFFEQRRFHWTDCPPDPIYLTALLTAIHRLSGGSVPGPADELP